MKNHDQDPTTNKFHKGNGAVDCDFNIPDFILARLVMRHLQTLMQLNHELHAWKNGSIQDNDELNSALKRSAERGE